MSHQEISDFFTLPCTNKKYPKLNNFEYIRQYAFKKHPDTVIAQESVSHMLNEVYTRAPKLEYLTVYYCTRIIDKFLLSRNYLTNWYHGKVQIEDNEEFLEWAEYQETKTPDPYETLYEEELALEGFSDKMIQKLALLKWVVNNMHISYREFYKLYYEQKMTIREISELKKIPSTSVFRMKHRLLALVKKEMLKPENQTKKLY